MTNWTDLELTLLGEGSTLYALVDAAQFMDLVDRLENLQVQFRSLYEGPEGEQLEDVAPFLVSLGVRDSRSRFFESQWPKNAGIFFVSSASFDEVRRHLRHFLKVKTWAGDDLFFRFYDPRVLQAFLPTCSAEQLKDFFGPVKAFSVAATGREFWVYRLDSNGLQTSTVGSAKEN